MWVDILLEEVGEDDAHQEYHDLCNQGRDGGGDEQVLLVADDRWKPHGGQCRLQLVKRLRLLL